MNDRILVKILPCGQGDCIVLEWVKGDTEKIGIIDCNSRNANPKRLVNYIVKKGYKELDFVLMTHPHYDHYSGIKKLLKLCFNRPEPIVVNNFIATIDAQFVRYDEQLDMVAYVMHKTSPKYRSRLYGLLKFVYEQKGTNILKTKNFNDTSVYTLNENVEIKCVAPSNEEHQKFFEIEAGKPGTVEPPNNPTANYLSSVIAVVNSNTRDCLALFTSDCESDTFQRLLDPVYRQETPIEKDVPLFQIPHHGSVNNHNEGFWSEISVGDSHTFLSVGRNNWGHPSSSVVKYFKKNARTFRSTIDMDSETQKDDVMVLWSKTESSVLNDSEGVEIKYTLDIAGNCELIDG